MPGKQLDNQGDRRFDQNKHVLFIRHGESKAHVGQAATHIEVVGLTEAGKAQALSIAEELPRAPDLIVRSHYLRAWETAEPTMKRFPETPHTTWNEVCEFTYLGSLQGKFMTKQERSVYVNEYWQNGVPRMKDGAAESFVEFIQRVRGALQRLRMELQTKDFIVVFTHEQFIRAAQCLLLQWEIGMEEDSQCMKDFREMLLKHPLPYGYRDDESWPLYAAQERAREQAELRQAEALRADMALLPEVPATYASKLARS